MTPWPSLPLQPLCKSREEIAGTTVSGFTGKKKATCPHSQNYTIELCLLRTSAIGGGNGLSLLFWGQFSMGAKGHHRKWGSGWHCKNEAFVPERLSERCYWSAPISLDRQRSEQFFRERGGEEQQGDLWLPTLVCRLRFTGKWNRCGPATSCSVFATLDSKDSKASGPETQALPPCLPATIALKASHNLKEETNASCSLSILSSFLHFDQTGLRDQMWTRGRFDWEEPQENT